MRSDVTVGDGEQGGGLAYNQTLRVLKIRAKHQNFAVVDGSEHLVKELTSSANVCLTFRFK